MMKGIDIFGRKFITLKVGIMMDSGKLFKTGQVFFKDILVEIYGWVPFLRVNLFLRKVV